jgi:signal transduction histidine kinase
MWRWPAELLRSTVFRISLLNAALLALAIGGALGGAWFATRGSVELAARDRITVEGDAVASELDREGIAGAAAAIGWRSSRPGALDYLLVDPAGRVAAGDMTTVPRGPGWHRFRIPASAGGRSQGEEMLARTMRRSDGTVIAVGEDLARGEEVREALFGVILPAGAVALLLGLIASVVVTRRALRRMEGIVATVRSVEAGDLSSRVVRIGQTHDDVDELGVAINRMLDRIGTLLAAVRRVSAEIAHDLRTPLTHASHALQAARHSGSEEVRLRAIDTASDSIAQALRLFEAMLALAEIDSGEARAHFTRVDLVTIGEQVVDAYRAEIEASGRCIEWTGEGTAVVSGDADLLTQAVANLVDNALKHSRDGAWIGVSVNVRGDVASVVVADDGPGVDPQAVDRMLRPFGRLDEARSTPGNGLGLAIVNGIARLHGGRLVLEHLLPGLSAAVELPTAP